MYTDPTPAMVNALVVHNATVLHYINARHSICQSNDLQLCNCKCTNATISGSQAGVHGPIGIGTNATMNGSRYSCG